MFSWDGRAGHWETCSIYIISWKGVLCFSFIHGCLANSSLMLKRLSFYGFQRKDNFESVVMEHLRMNGAYWGLTTLDLLGKLHTVDVDEVVSWLMSCQHDSGSSVFYLFPYFLLDISVIHSFLRENVLLWRGIWWKCWTWSAHPLYTKCCAGVVSLW